MTTIQINITKDVLKQSMFCAVGPGKDKEVGKNCAIAVAIRSLFPNATIGSDKVYFNLQPNDINDGRILPSALQAILPYEASEFIAEFDVLKKAPEKRLLMKEISFPLEIPDSLIDDIGIEEIHEVLKNCETMSLLEA